MNKIPVAVLGVGHLGQHHARIYSQMEEVELLGVVDTKLSQAEQIGNWLSVPAFRSLDELVNAKGQPKAVSIVVPTIHHYEIATPLLKQGVHVLIEKPITAHLSEAQELERLAKQYNVVAAVGHVEQFNSGLRELRRLVNKPLFIRALRVGPYNGRISDVGVVLDLMIYDLEIILSMVDSPLTELHGSMTALKGTHEDLACAELVFENGTMAQLVSSRIAHEKRRELEVTTYDATYKLNFATQELHSIHLGLDPINGGQVESVQQHQIAKSEPLKLELEHFIDCVREGKSPLVDLSSGRAALEVALKILEGNGVAR